MKATQLSILAACLLAANIAQGVMNIDTVLVGDAGNPNDTTGFGQVNYTYRIGTYEVTNAQYAVFLNAVAATDPYGLYNSNMGSNARGGITQSGASGSFSYSTRENMANKPVNFVSFYDAVRFANWLTTGNTETGVYDLTNVSDPATYNLTRNETAWLAGGVAIASEDEWYKAAYYSGSPTGADGDGYWLYSVQSNTLPTQAGANGTGDVTNPGASVVNYNNAADWNSQNGNVTTVGSAGAMSYYGTFDQGGNVWELTDKLDVVINPVTLADNRLPVRRGGAYDDGWWDLGSDRRSANAASFQNVDMGFRVTSLNPIVVPEPSTHALLALGAGALFLAKRRRQSVS